MGQSFFVYAPQVVIGIIFDILGFLPWWYTKGIHNEVKRTRRFLSRRWHDAALIVWLRSFFKPLYEDLGVWGMTRSLMSRSLQIVFRAAMMIMCVVAAGTWLALFSILPLISIWQIIYQLII